MKIFSRLNRTVLIPFLFLLIPITAWTGTPLGNFNPGQDLFLPQFDSKTDVDDIHSVAGVGTLLRDPRLADVNYLAVAGAYGIQEGLYVPAPQLFDLVFGERWANAHQHREQSIEEVAQRVSKTLTRGGSIWVAEAGQSDFTADWLKRVNEMNLPVSSKDRVHVVQHSDWNESVTSPDKLSYVKQHANYHKIPDGNFLGNGSPGFNSDSNHIWEQALNSPKNGESWAMAKAIGEEYNGVDGRYENASITAGGIDFSDVSESCWIFGFAGLKDAEAFFSEFPGLD